MTNIVSVPVCDLLRVAPFTGEQDVRYYLNGVLVTPWKDHALLVATNGHWLGVMESHDARTDQPRILDLPRPFLNQLDKSQWRTTSQDDERDAEEDPTRYRSERGTLTVADESSRIVITEEREIMVKPGRPFIEGKYPEWRKVIPDQSTLEPGLFTPFTPSYLARLHEAVPTDREHALHCFQSRTESKMRPAVFRFSKLPGLMIVLMPRRNDDKLGEWPEWANKPEMPAESSTSGEGVK